MAKLSAETGGGCPADATIAPEAITFLVAPAANPWDSKDAAAATAAFKVLTGLFPAQLATLQPPYNTYIAALPDEPVGSKAAGIRAVSS